MKVVILCDTGTWGGLESHVVALTDALVEVGHEVRVASLNPKGRPLYQARVHGSVSVIDVRVPGRRTVWSWWRALAGLEADALVFEKGTLWTGGFGLDLALRLKYRRFITILQLEPPPLPKRESRRYLGGTLPGVGLWWYRWKWSGYFRSLMPQKTVCVSQSVRRRLLTDYAFPPATTVTIPNGVDPTKFGPDLKARTTVRRAWGIPEDAIVFGSVGRLEVQKGLDIAVRAFSSVLRANMHRNLYLVLVGEGSERRVLAEHAKALGAQDRVIFAGFTPTPRTAYQALDFFLIPSRFEGLPFSLVEAMACGCRIIGSAVGGISEVIVNQDMGLLVPPEDPGALADAMGAALGSSPTRARQQVDAARRRVSDSYDVRVQCAKVIALLERRFETNSSRRLAPKSIGLKA